MKLDSYWTDSAPAFVPRAARAARAVRRGDRRRRLHRACRRRWRWPGAAPRWSVLEAGERVAAEASGRNGGHVNNGLAVDYAEVAAKVGVERARAWYHAYDAAVDAVERLVRDEAIDCDFVRHGKLKLATRPAHLDALSRSAERLVRRRRRHRRRDPATRHACAPRWQATASSAACSTSAAARCTWAASRTAWPQAAERSGAQIHTGTCVQRLERPRARGQAHRVHTSRGTRARAQQVLLATGAARHGGYGSFGWLRRRIVPIGSFIVVTEPLGAERAAGAAARAPHLRDGRQHPSLLPSHAGPPPGVRRARALRGVEPARRTRRAARSCAPAWSRPFRSCRDVGIDYCWGGLVDMTQDRLPHAGERDGLFYSIGYSGHGTQMSVLMGERMAAVMAGDASRQPVARPRVARDPGPPRAALVPARGGPVFPPEGSPRLKAPSTFFHDEPTGARHHDRSQINRRTRRPRRESAPVRCAAARRHRVATCWRC